MGRLIDMRHLLKGGVHFKLAEAVVRFVDGRYHFRDTTKLKKKENM